MVQHLEVCQCTRSPASNSRSGRCSTSSGVLPAVQGAPCGQHPFILSPPKRWKPCGDEAAWGTTGPALAWAEGGAVLGLGYSVGGGGLCMTMPAHGRASMGPRPLGALVPAWGHPAPGGCPSAPGTPPTPEPRPGPAFKMNPSL